MKVFKADNTFVSKRLKEYFWDVIGIEDIDVYICSDGSLVGWIDLAMEYVDDYGDESETAVRAYLACKNDMKAIALDILRDCLSTMDGTEPDIVQITNFIGEDGIDRNGLGNVQWYPLDRMGKAKFECSPTIEFLDLLAKYMLAGAYLKLKDTFFPDEEDLITRSSFSL